MRKGSEVTLHHPATLRLVRWFLGLSQESLADLADVSSGFIALIETGRRQPSRDNADAIVDACNKAAADKGLAVTVSFEALFTDNTVVAEGAA